MKIPRRKPAFTEWVTGYWGIALMLMLIPGLVTSAGALAASDWVFQGPAPITSGQQAVLDPPTSPVIGGVNAIVPNPSDPDLIYVGATGGGVWKTADGGAHWMSLSDELDSQSIAAMALDPEDPSGQTFIVGTSRYSGLGTIGDDLAGVYYTGDGGATWTTSTGTGGNLIKFPSGYEVVITAVAASGDTLLVSGRNAYRNEEGGVFRTTDGPTGTWTQLSTGNGLPSVAAGFIVGDPHDSSVFYAGFMSASGGIYKSTDKGASWTDITDGIPYTTADSTGFGISDLTNDMSAVVFNDGTTSVVTVVLSGTLGNASSTTKGFALYRSENGGPFTAMDYPSGIGDAMWHRFAMAADGTNPDLVYLGGYGERLYRLDASMPKGSQVSLLREEPTLSAPSLTPTSYYTYAFDSIAGLPTTPPFPIRVDEEQMTVTRISPHADASPPYWFLYITRGINGTTATDHAGNAGIWPLSGSSIPYGATHSDYTVLAIDADGRLLAGNHGGIYRLPEPASPSSSTNYWTALNTDLAVTEIHDIAYDHVSHTLFIGIQDNGTAVQNEQGGLVWKRILSGDGGDVAVDDIGGGQSARYGSTQNLGGFTRFVYDASNALVSKSSLSTSVMTDKQFLTPIAVNAVAPKRLVVGGKSHIYESLDEGATFAALTDPVGVTRSTSKGPIVYGGRLGGVAKPDLLYVGYEGKVYVRTEAGGALAATASLPTGASAVQALAVDPDDYNHVFVATSNNHIYESSDSGGSWAEITGGLSANQLTALAYVPAPESDPYHESYLAVGTRAGVLASPVSSLGSWAPLGDLPSFVVFDLAYDATDDVLVAGTLGCGAYLLANASTALDTTTAMRMQPAADKTVGDRTDGAFDRVLSWLGRIGEHVLSAVIPSAEAAEMATPLIQVDLQQLGAPDQQTQVGWDPQELTKDPSPGDSGSFSLTLTSAGSSAGITAILGGDSNGWESRGGSNDDRAQITGTSIDDVLEDFVLTRDGDAYVSFTGLVVGDEYLFETWHNDSYTPNHGFGEGGGTVTPSVTGGAASASTIGTITNLYGAQTDGAFGATSVRFTATSADVIIDLDGTNPHGYLPINGIVFSHFQPDAPTATVTCPASALAGQVVQFVLKAIDPSPANQAAGFTYAIDWGDGSPIQTVDPVAGTGDATARHAFAGTGTYTVQVTATNQEGGVSDPATAEIQVDALTAGSLQALLSALPVVYFQPLDDAALQNEVAAVNGLSDPGSPVDITLVLGAGPYGPVVLGPSENINLNLAGNYTADSLIVIDHPDTEEPSQTTLSADATYLDAGDSGPAVTVTQGKTFVQGDALTTAAAAPTILVTGGHLTLSQGNIQESTGANNAAIEVTGTGQVTLGFDMFLNVNGEGTFIRSPDREGVEPPKGIDAELSPNVFSVNGVALKANALSSTVLTSWPGSTDFGQPVIFTATTDVEVEEGGAPTGTVEFYDGTTLLGSGTVMPFDREYLATFTTSDLAVGTHTITAVYTGDEHYISSESMALDYTVEPYTFTGFFRPVKNPPTLNKVKAGLGIPIKFSLDGDRGLDILAPGYPRSQQIQCDSGEPVGEVGEPAASYGRLRYNQRRDQYVYVWKTQKSWKRTCRRFDLRLQDGTDHTALFSFVRRVPFACEIRPPFSLDQLLDCFVDLH